MASLSDHRRAYTINRRAAAIDHLGGRCAACGSTESLQFDHVDPRTKSITISAAITAHWSWERLLVELAKCQLLCVPHHIEKSRREARAKVTHGKYHAAYHLCCDCDLCVEFKREYRQSKRSDRPRLPPGEFEHGTRAGYLKERREGLVPCDPCKAANAAYAVELRERRSVAR